MMFVYIYIYVCVKNFSYVSDRVVIVYLYNVIMLPGIRFKILQFVRWTAFMGVTWKLNVTCHHKTSRISPIIGCQYRQKQWHLVAFCSGFLHRSIAN